MLRNSSRAARIASSGCFNCASCPCSCCQICGRRPIQNAAAPPRRAQRARRRLMNNTTTMIAERPGGSPRRSSRGATGPSIRPMTMPSAIGARMYSPACQREHERHDAHEDDSDLRALRQKHLDIRLGRQPDDRRLLWQIGDWCGSTLTFPAGLVRETHFHGRAVPLRNLGACGAFWHASRRKEFSNGDIIRRNRPKPQRARPAEDLAADIEQLKADIAKLTEQLHDDRRTLLRRGPPRGGGGRRPVRAQGEAAYRRSARPTRRISKTGHRYACARSR